LQLRPYRSALRMPPRETWWGVSSLVSGQPSPAFEVKAHTTPGLNLGAAIPESAYGLAQLAKGYSAPPARRKFTNDDIERLKKDDAQR
jgi:hypothetical protein